MATGILIIEKNKFEIQDNNDFKNKLYNEIRKSLKNNRILDKYAKSKLIKYAKKHLPEYLNYARLNNIFIEFLKMYNDELVKIDFKSDMKILPIEYVYDDILWSGTIECKDEFIFLKSENKKIKFKCLDIKLLNDGFIYNDDILTEGKSINKHQRTYDQIKHEEKYKFDNIIQFLKTTLKINNVAVFLCEREDRIDFSAKNFNDCRSVSITYEYGIHNDELKREDWN